MKKRDTDDATARGRQTAANDKCADFNNKQRDVISICTFLCCQGPYLTGSERSSAQ